MKFISYLFVCCIMMQFLQADFYHASLDAIIAQKIQALEESSYEVKNIEKIVETITRSIKKQATLHDAYTFLDPDDSIIFFFQDQVQLKLNGAVTDEAMAVLQDFKDLKFALAAKLYLYYLECAKQKMLYRATVNYDTLHYWKNELFAENLAFYNKNILRWVGSSSYQNKIKKNIEQLEKVSYSTNYFLGLLCQNQEHLLQAQTQQEFKDSLIQAARLQNDFLHTEDDITLDNIGLIIKKSLVDIDQWSTELSQLYSSCQMPSHFIRHWKGYTLSTAAFCAAAYVYLKYGGSIAQGVEYSWNEHARAPIERMMHTLTGVAKHPELEIEKNKQMLEASNIAASKQLPALDDQHSVAQAFVISINNCSQDELAQFYKEICHKIEIVDKTAQRAVEVVGVVEKTVPDILQMRKEILACKEIIGWLAQEKYGKMTLQQIGQEIAGKSDCTIPEILANAQEVTMEQVLNKFPKTYVVNAAKWLVMPSGDKKSDKPFPEIKPFVPSNHDTIAYDAPAEKEAEWSLYKSMQPVVADPTMPYKNMPPFDLAAAPKQVDYSNHSSQELENAIFENDVKILAHPERNVLNAPGAGYRMGLRELINVKEQTNKILKDMHLVLGLTALIPVVSVVGGSLFASKNLYNSVAYQPIRIFVRHLEVLFNELLYQQTTCDRQGQLYFLLEQLSLHIQVLTLGEQKTMQEDIAALKNNCLDYVQKYNIVQRMYKTYPCLLPAGA